MPLKSPNCLSQTVHNTRICLATGSVQTAIRVCVWNLKNVLIPCPGIFFSVIKLAAYPHHLSHGVIFNLLSVTGMSYSPLMCGCAPSPSLGTWYVFLTCHTEQTQIQTLHIIRLFLQVRGIKSVCPHIPASSSAVWTIPQSIQIAHVSGSGLQHFCVCRPNLHNVVSSMHNITGPRRVTV